MMRPIQRTGYRDTGWQAMILPALLSCICVVLSGCATYEHDADFISNVIADSLGEGNYAPQPEGASVEDIMAQLQEPIRTPEAERPRPVKPKVYKPKSVPPKPSPAVAEVKPAPPELPKPAVTTAPPVQAEVVRPAPPVQPETPKVAIAETPPEPKPAVAETTETQAVTVAEAPPPAPRAALEIKPTIATIQPDSVLWITVEEDPSLNGRYTVSTGAGIDFGYVGLVILQDMTVERAERTLKTVLEGRYLQHATVAVRIAKASYDLVGVRGYVEQQGELKIGPGCAISLAEALRRAGGVRLGKDNMQVKVVRGGVVSPFGPAAEGEVYPLASPGGQLKVPDVYLRNNDLVYVYAYESARMGLGGKRILLLGEVPRRGVVDFAENEPCTLMYLLFKVGGLPRFAKSEKIRIVRRDRDGHEMTIVANGESLLTDGNPDDDVTLESGDRVIVPARKITFF